MRIQTRAYNCWINSGQSFSEFIAAGPKRWLEVKNCGRRCADFYSKIEEGAFWFLSEWSELQGGEKATYGLVLTAAVQWPRLVLWSPSSQMWHLIDGFNHPATRILGLHAVHWILAPDEALRGPYDPPQSP